jgi:uncharacterized protein (DUF305 family)
MKYAVVLVAAVALIATGCGGNDAADADRPSAQQVPFDRAFIDAMVPHHRSAIEMANAAQQAGLPVPALIGIADNIVRTQQREIDQMLRWRQQWYGSRQIDPNAGDQLGMSVEEMGMSHDAGDLRGGNVDAQFASMMTDHHEGAIAMARMALERSQHPEIKQLAGRIIAAQEAEVKIMRPYAGEMEGQTMTGMTMG